MYGFCTHQTRLTSLTTHHNRPGMLGSGNGTASRIVFTTDRAANMRLVLRKQHDLCDLRPISALHASAPVT